jgi:hypothetical protein
MLTIDLVYSSSSSSVLGVGLDGLPMLREGWRSSGGRGGANGDAEGACRATVVVLVYCSVKEKGPDSLVAWVKKYTKHQVLDWS